MEALVDGAILEYVLKIDRSIDNRPVFSNETNGPSNITAQGVTTEAVLVPIAMGLVFLLGVLGNLTLMHVVARFTAMRHNAVYVYATNIAVAHFLTLMASVPFSALTYTLPEWPFGEVICKVGKFMITVSSAVTVLSLAALSVDRYCALTCESRCVGGTSCTNTTLALILVWFVAISVAIPDFVSAFIMVLPNAYRPGETVKVCFPYPETWGRDYPTIQTLVKGTLIFALPMFVALLFVLIVAVQVASKCMKRTEVAVTPDVEPTTDTASMDDIYATPTRTKRLREDTSDNDSEDTLSEETKQRFVGSLKLIVLLLLTFTACWLPYYVYWLLFFYSRGQLVGTGYQEPFRVVAFCLTLFSNSINPYVLCASDGTFRACFGRSLACTEKKRRKKKRRQKKSRTKQWREKTRKIPHSEEPVKSRRRRARTQRRSRGRPYLYMDRYLNDYSAPYVASDDHYFVGTQKPVTMNDYQYSTLPAKLGGSQDNFRNNYIPYPAQGLCHTDTGSYDEGIHWTGRSDPLSGVGRRQPIYEPTNGAKFWEPVYDYAPAYKTIEKYRRGNMSDIKEESHGRVPSPTVSDSPSIEKPKGVYV